MRSTIFIAAGLVVIGLGAQAFAASSQDAAYDQYKAPVTDSHGGCVRTKWEDNNDPCVAPKREVKIAPRKARLSAAAEREARTLYFDFNKATLSKESTAKLDELANIINSSSSIEDVTIHGYTDQIGSDSYNTSLAQKRVAAAKDYLDGKSRLKAEGDIRGIGKASPEAGCDNSKKRANKIKCMAKERRVEIEFNAKK